jgi:hypothetical protein
MSAIQWLAPRPLWADFAGAARRAAFRRPAVLRFAKDTFMEDLQALLASRSGDLRTYVARPESWRAPIAGLDAPVSMTAPSGGRRCRSGYSRRIRASIRSPPARVPGARPPDHTVKVDEGETIAFVIRRVDPATTTGATVFDSATRQEYA